MLEILEYFYLRLDKRVLSIYQLNFTSTFSNNNHIKIYSIAIIIIKIQYNLNYTIKFKIIFTIFTNNSNSINNLKFEINFHSFIVNSNNKIVFYIFSPFILNVFKFRRNINN